MKLLGTPNKFALYEGKLALNSQYLIESTGTGNVYIYDLNENFIKLGRLDWFENIKNLNKKGS